MECLSCKTPLKPLTTSAATIDFCPACKSVWFDRDELKKFDDPKDQIPEEINIPAATPAVDYSHGARKCPVCPDSFMARRSFDVHNKVEVDQCVECSGIWLDGGEIAAIRQLYPSEAARAKAEDNWLNERLQETDQKITKEIGKEMLQIEANKKTIQYRLFRAVSNFLDLEPE